MNPVALDINDAQGTLVVSLATDDIQGRILSSAQRAAAIWTAAAAIARRLGVLPNVQPSGSLSFKPLNDCDAFETVVALEEEGFIACYHDA